MSTSLQSSLLFAVVSALSLTAACKREPSPAASLAAATRSDKLPEVLATIGDTKITLSDIRSKAGGDLDQLDAQYARARSRIIEDALDDVIRERLLNAEATKQGKSIDELVLAEAGGTLEPSENEVSRWYVENQSRLAGRPLDGIRAQIVELLRNEKLKVAQEKLKQRLNSEQKVSIKFQPYRLVFNNENAPSSGNPDAPIQVVEFSDFQCPFCRQFAPNLNEIRKHFGDKVHLVYKQYPIPSIHPFALKAAEASLCANEQGKFWQLHDLMFGEQSKLSVMDLKEKASRIGVDRKQFDACLDRGKYTEQVQKDMNEGARAGVSGTPALFVNGVEVPGGAVPFSTVSAAIERELARRN